VVSSPGGQRSVGRAGFLISMALISGTDIDLEVLSGRDLQSVGSGYLPETDDRVNSWRAIHSSYWFVPLTSFQHFRHNKYVRYTTIGAIYLMFTVTLVCPKPPCQLSRL